MIQLPALIEGLFSFFANDKMYFKYNYSSDHFLSIEGSYPNSFFQFLRFHKISNFELAQKN
jgi:hypothetical protein